MVNTPRSELALTREAAKFSGSAVPVDWQILPGLSSYAETLAAMEARVKEIADG